MTDDDIQRAFVKGMRAGVQSALAEHKCMGRSIVVERDGKIVEIPPEEIEVDEEFLIPSLPKAL